MKNKMVINIIMKSYFKKKKTSNKAKEEESHAYAI